MSPMPADDFFLFSGDLSEQENARREEVRSFVETALLPVINEHWENATFPVELLPHLRRLGIAGTTISGYGCPGLTAREAGLVAMELARGDGSVNTFMAVQSGLTMGTIHRLGSEEQRRRWLPRMAALEAIGAFALTEPDHGSDSVALETSATRRGSHYVLTGHKRWIGNASMADVTVVWARDTADGEVKAFVIERAENGDFPDGYRPSVITGKTGKRAVLQADITIDAVEVPASHLLVRSKSFHDAVGVLNTTRTGASWEALGHAAAAYDIAARYARDRHQFGQQIGGYQLVQNLLARMLGEVTAMYALCFRAAELTQRETLTGAMSSMLKLHTASKARWVCQGARDILAGNGLLLERHVARHLSDMEVVHTYEGTEFIQSLLVGREITGISAFGGRRRS